MLNSKSMSKGIDNRSRVKKSPVGVITAQSIKMAIVASGLWRVMVSTSTIPSFIKKKTSKGSWNKRPLPRRHHRKKFRYLPMFMSGWIASLPKERRNLRP